MKDVDSATKRLDNILMTLYFLVVMLIFAVMLVSFELVKEWIDGADLWVRRMRQLAHLSRALALSSSACPGSSAVPHKKVSPTFIPFNSPPDPPSPQSSRASSSYSSNTPSTSATDSRSTASHTP